MYRQCCSDDWKSNLRCQCRRFKVSFKQKWQDNRTFKGSQTRWARRRKKNHRSRCKNRKRQNQWPFEPFPLLGRLSLQAKREFPMGSTNSFSPTLNKKCNSLQRRWFPHYWLRWNLVKIWNQRPRTDWLDQRGKMQGKTAWNSVGGIFRQEPWWKSFLTTGMRQHVSHVDRI